MRRPCQAHVSMELSAYYQVPCVRAAADLGGGGGSGEFAADESEVRGGTDWRARTPEPLIRDGTAGHPIPYKKGAFVGF
jgi:hypothetical protein